MRNDIAVLVLMSHPSEDARILKHWEYVCSNYNERALFQYLMNNETKNTQNNNWYVVRDFLCMGKLQRRFHLYLKNRSFITGVLKVISAWQAEHVIVHIHDAALLSMAVAIKKSSNKSIKIIYDKHENGHLLTVHLSEFEILFNEWCTAHYIDGIVFVSESMESIINQIWGKRIHSVLIPNYPKGSWRDFTRINDKLRNNSSIRAVYFGSLGEDRDIALVCAVSKRLLTAFPQLKVIIGGRSATSSTVQLLNEMESNFSQRFAFLGEVPYSEVIRKTQEARFGFLPIKAGRGMKNKAVASNKLGEYLLMGVVPLISWGDSLPVISNEYYISISNDNDYMTAVKGEMKNAQIAQRIIKGFADQTWEKYVEQYGNIYKEVFVRNVL